MDFVRDWWAVLTGAIGAILGVGVSYGVHSTKLAEVERRLERTEKATATMDDKLDEALTRLTRIEAKLEK